MIKWIVIALLGAIFLLIGSSFYIYEIKHHDAHLHSQGASPPPFENVVVDFRHSLLGHDPEQVVCYRESHRNFYIFTLYLLSTIIGLVVVGFINQRRYSKGLVEKNEEIARQKILIEESNESLISSIRYASSIQRSFLPTLDQIENLIGNTSFFYQPKDLVGGDFFWIGENKDWKMVALGDCTGHGVPGALLTLTCLHLLNGLVDKNHKTPADMLAELEMQFCASLSAQEIQDGLDISLCFFSKHGPEAIFAGAHQSILVDQNGEKTELKGDRKGIGNDYLHLNKPFQNQHFNLSSKSRILLFSDGIHDQFGGENQKKWGKKNWIQVYEKHNLRPLKELGAELTQAFNLWKNNLAQTDDATFILLEPQWPQPIV